MRAGLAALALAALLAGCHRDPRSACQRLEDQLDSVLDRGDDKAALPLAEQGMRACPASADAQIYWTFDSSKAEILNRAGQYGPALAILRRDPPRGPAFARLRCNRRMEQAWAEYSRANYAEAERYLDMAEQEARQSGPREANLLAEIDMRRTFVYDEQRKFDAAEAAFARIRRSPGNMSPAYVFTSYGYMLIQSARFEEAAASFERALPDLEAAKNPGELAKIYNNLGSIYYKLGDLQRSLACTLKAELLLRDASDPVTLQICLNTAGLNYLERGDFQKAEDYLSRALDLSQRQDARKRKSEVLRNLALAAIGTGNWGRADDYNRRALELERDLNDAEAQQATAVSQARVLAGRARYPDALDALARVPPNVDSEQEYISIYRKLKDEARARAHYHAAIALSESVRAGIHNDENKLAWYGSRISLTQEWVRFLIEAHHIDEALETVESSRARLMTERIGGAPSASRGTVSAYRRLARNATLVSYWLMPEISYVWIVNPQSVEVRPLPGEDRIASLVEAYGNFLTARRDPLHAGNGSGEQLRQAVLDPVLPLLGDAKDVVVVPDGPLHALNFETLPVNGHYWIDDATITVAPSLNILTAANSSRPKADSAALVVGDAEPTADFPKLPDAAREIQSVAGVFARSTVLQGARATPAAYLSAPDSAQYIHFAAHASANAERPLDSAVILSKGSLTAHDLLAKPIHAELVTISACRSAGVRSYHGEGLVGFAWVFLQTGAHGVIAGLWDASDNATADIMSDLYARIVKGESPAAALRDAKLKLVHGQSHLNRPFYWAPFQYYQGAGR